MNGLNEIIRNKKELLAVKFSMILSLIVLLGGIILIYTGVLFSDDPEITEEYIRRVGNYSRKLIWFSFLLYPASVVLKKTKLPIKKVVLLIRRFHVPAAIVSAGLALLHGIMAIKNDFSFNLGYLSGIFSICSFGVLIYLGFKRYKNQYKRSHFILGVLFAVVILTIHSNMVKL